MIRYSPRMYASGISRRTSAGRAISTPFVVSLTATLRVTQGLLDTVSWAVWRCLRLSVVISRKVLQLLNLWRIPGVTLSRHYRHCPVLFMHEHQAATTSGVAPSRLLSLTHFLIQAASSASARAGVIDEATPKLTRIAKDTKIALIAFTLSLNGGWRPPRVDSTDVCQD